ncbi:MAG: hypothetical protein C5B50_11330 [Verrucomicrobia bacterium]|nr:MAG: hypothetical protein C5B50_11330 [Verrucomicrobiota bacterium]
MLKPVCLLAFAIVITRTSSAETLPSLGSSAIRYGQLMTDHWLNVDVARQIERAVFYTPQSKRGGFLAELETLQKSLTALEKQLDSAQGLYKQLFITNAAQSSAELDMALNRIASAETAAGKTALELLKRLGQASAGNEFRALPIANEDLAPAWNKGHWLDANRRPRRILFGSTGKAGDDRTLPLRFDFSGGVFGFNIPMTASNRLDIPQAFRDGSAPEFNWMRTNHSGYHYWAGVYNNQNSYVAPGFLAQHINDDDIWMKLADGKVLKSANGWGQLNIWNPRARDYLEDYCEAQGRALRDDPFLVCYDYTAEPHPFGSQPPGQPQYSGYNASAIRAFRDYLKNKFQSISSLNQAWHSNYSAFDSISPPADPYISPPEKATPLSYEFELFRCHSHMLLWKSLYDAYRKGDPVKPIVANAGMFMSGWPVEALDSWQLQKSGAMDWVDMHMNNFWPNLPEQIYLYSLCRLSGKIPVQFEYVWTFPRTGPLDDSSESDFRAACQASVWRNLVWGKKALVFFDFYYDWPAYHNAFFNRDLGYSILRPSACVVPVTKRKALRFNDILMQTEIANPPIVILQPTASILNSPPQHPNQNFSYHTTVAGKQVHDLLFPRNYPFLYVPEEAVLDGYSLSQHKVVILPQAPYLPEKVTDRLLTWIKSGGTLISLGLPGLWNPYGHDDLRLVSQTFGQTRAADRQPGHWIWQWELVKTNSSVTEQIYNEKGHLTAASAHFVKGRVLISTGPFDSANLQALFYRVLDQSIGAKPASCDRNLFELVLRKENHGQQYLFVLNPHTRDSREDRISVQGKFARCVDLGIGSGIPMPVTVEHAETSFRLRLYPGEGTVISLSL